MRYTLAEEDADRALRELAPILAELRREGFDHQLAQARRLREAVLSAARSFTQEET